MNEGFPEIGEQNGWADTACIPDLETLRRAAHHDRAAIVLGDLWWSPERARRDLAAQRPARPVRARRGGRADAVGGGRVRVLRLRRRRTRRPARRGTAHLEPRAPRRRPTTSSTASTATRSCSATCGARSSASGIPVESIKSEMGHGQYEITFQPSRRPGGRRPRRARQAVHARGGGAATACAATFMARLEPAGMGSSGHIHLSRRGPRRREPVRSRRHRSVGARPALHRRDHAPRARVHAAGLPVRELVQAARPGQLRDRGAGLRRRGPDDPVPRLRPRPLAQRRVPDPGRRRQPVPGPGGDGGGRAWRASSRAPSRSPRAPPRPTRSARSPTTCATRSNAGGRRRGRAPRSATWSSTRSRWPAATSSPCSRARSPTSSCGAGSSGCSGRHRRRGRHRARHRAAPPPRRATTSWWRTSSTRPPTSTRPTSAATSSTSSASLAALRAAVGAELSVLVNAAGIVERTTFGEHTEQEWERIFAVNARAPLFVVQGLADLFHEGSAIVNVTSMEANHVVASTGRTTSIYASTKAALREPHGDPGGRARAARHPGQRGRAGPDRDAPDARHAVRDARLVPRADAARRVRRAGGRRRRDRVPRLGRRALRDRRLPSPSTAA